MPRATLIVCLLLSLFPAILTAESLPKAEITEKEFDFGKVKTSAGIISHDFIILNQGDADLQIHKVAPG